MITTQIVPAVLTSDPNDFKAQIERYGAFTKRIQVDIADGAFTPTMTVPLNTIQWPADLTVDLHMMVVRPSEQLPTILQLKPSLCIFHAETGEDLVPLFEQLKAAGIKTGVALVKTTYPGLARRFIEAADHVLVFAGELGRQGSEADLMQIEKAGIIRGIKSEIEIGWDGGANMRNIRAIAHADFDVINVGNALHQAEDPAGLFKEMSDEVDRRGVVL